jgi:hypothetical protein
MHFTKRGCTEEDTLVPDVTVDAAVGQSKLSGGGAAGRTTDERNCRRQLRFLAILKTRFRLTSFLHGSKLFYTLLLLG